MSKSIKVPVEIDYFEEGKVRPVRLKRLNFIDICPKREYNKIAVNNVLH